MTVQVIPERRRDDAADSGRFTSRTRVAFGSLYWLGWLVGSPRSVLASGVARELEELGAGALRLVASSAVLVGLIAVFQVAYQLQYYSAESLSAKTIAWFAWRELGPVAVALLVVSRSASAIAGELAAMASNAEIDTLRAMGLDPVKHLVAPRLGALLVAVPSLTIIADGLIMIGAWLGSSLFLGLTTRFFIEQTHGAVGQRDLVIGLGKSVLFAFLVAVISADEGLNVSRAPGAVARASSRAVVHCLIAVLAADTFINAVFYFIPTLVF